MAIEWRYKGGVGFGRLPNLTEPTQLGDYKAHLEDGWKTPVFQRIHRIPNVNAWVLKDTANNIVVFQSYYTVVAMYMEDGSAVRFDRYSRTTDDHLRRCTYWCDHHRSELGMA